MRLVPWSDIHAELNPSNPHMLLNLEDRVPKGADLIVCAGDLTHARWMRHVAKGVIDMTNLPVIYVPGNHDFYLQDSMEGALEEIEGVALASINEGWRQEFINLHRKVEFNGGVRFIGATLWTDFMMGIEHLTGSDLERELAYRHFEAPKVLRDYQNIWPMSQPNGVLRPSYVSELNRQDVDFIRQALEEPFEGRTIVVTHHLPTPDCTPDVYRDGPNSKFNYLFANSTLAFGDILENDLAPDLWIAGHTHHAVDKMIGPKTRFVCNPHGYDAEFYGGNGFDWGKIIDTDDLTPSPARGFR